MSSEAKEEAKTKLLSTFEQRTKKRWENKKGRAEETTDEELGITDADLEKIQGWSAKSDLESVWGDCIKSVPANPSNSQKK